MRTPKTYWLLFFAVFASFCTHAMPAGNSSSATQFANVPVASFLENKGQIKDQYGKPRADIQFRMSGKGINIFIGNGQVHYQWDIVDTGSRGATYRMDMTLLGSNKHARVIADEKREYFERLIARNEEFTMSSFNKVTYKDIYPGIDWVLYSKEGQLKYDFIVHPGGNPADIKMEYKHATTLAVDNGVFTAKTPAGSITEDAPYCYDAVTRQVVPSAFKLNGKVLSFDVKTNGKHDLVIDPTVFWATYFGNGHIFRQHDISTDHFGNAYMVANIVATSNLATSGNPYYGISLIPYFESIISKFSPSGVRLWAVYWTTYGFGTVEPHAVTCDQAGDIYVAGKYYDPNWGYPNGRLTKYSSSGNRLWSKDYLYYTEIFDLVCDKSNNLYFCGYGSLTERYTTPPPVFIPGALKPATLAKYDSAGNKIWGVYYGGAGDDIFTGIALDTFGNIYASGITRSDTGIAIPGSFQPSFSQSYSSQNTPFYADAFLVKFNSAGHRIWGTYYGGIKLEYATKVACDDTGNVYMCGTTLSNTGISSANGYDTSFGGVSDGYMVKFDSNGARKWATYIGGSSADSLSDIRKGANGNVYIAGVTFSTGIATTGSIQASSGGGQDAFFGEYSGAGTPLWITYYGGTANEYAGRVAYSQAKYLYLSGVTGSISNIATPGAFIDVQPGIYPNYSPNEFLVCIPLDTFVHIKPRFSDTALCTQDTLRIPYHVTFPFRSGNVFTVQLSDTAGGFSSPLNIGSITSIQNDTIKCILPSSLLAGKKYKVRIVSTSPARISADNGFDLKLPQPVNLTASANTPICEGDTLRLSAISSNTSMAYIWTGPLVFSSSVQNPKIDYSLPGMTGNYIVSVNNNGCTVKDTVAVVINPRPAKPVITTNDPVCELDTLKLFSGSATVGASYSWSGPSGFTASQKDTFIALVPLAAAGTYYAIAELNGCRDTGSKAITIKPKPSLPAIVADSTVCEADTLMLGGTSTTPGVSYVWHGPGGFSSSIQQPLIPSAELLNTGMFSLVTVGTNGCISDSVHQMITVRPLPDTVYAVTDTLICTGRKMNLRSGPAAPGVSFSWTGPNGFTSQQQDTAIQSANLLMHGDYIVTATLNGCSVSDTVFAYIKGTAPTPIPIPNTPVCIGDSILFRAVIQPAVGVDYNWYGPNGFVATAELPFKVVATLADTGWYYVFTTNNHSCASDTVAMHVSVLTHSMPAVTIAATPATATGPYTKITYTATPVNEGTNPLYIWMKNGIRIPGANGNTLEMVTAVDLATGDVVSVAMVSSMLCVWPDTVLSNTWSVFVDLNVKEMAGIGVNVFPNPTNGILNIANGSGLQYTITDIAGRQITSGKVDSTERLDIKDLYPGNYILKLSDGHMSTHVRITKQ